MTWSTYILEMSRRSAVAVAPGPGSYHGFSAMKLPLGPPDAITILIEIPNYIELLSYFA